MARIHAGATLKPHFSEFLPPWIARQPRYAGARGGIPALAPVGYFRMEDPAGEVGIETHLVRDGSVLYQVPMTYRGAPLAQAQDSLISTAEHSVLGTRWIYDATADPVWIEQLLELVRTGAVSDPSLKRGVGPAEVRGRWLGSGVPTPETVAIELKRIVVAAEPGPELEPGVVGVVTGGWHPDGPDGPMAEGCMAVLHEGRHLGEPLAP